MESQPQNPELGIILKTFTHVYTDIVLTLSKKGISRNVHGMPPMEEVCINV